jgi:acetyltransferase-like isoleucine patch superfamily enzyme
MKARYYGYKTPCFIHKNTFIHSTVKIGSAVYVLPGTHVMPLTDIDDYTMISMGVNIAHHVKLCKGCFLSQGTNIGASMKIEERTFIGIGATIMTGVKTIGENATVGAGSVVIRDIPDDAIVIGNPAKILRFKREAATGRDRICNEHT